MAHNSGPTPIPTTYAGVKFRSRQEARWAVFFDALQLEWYYEVEGYQLPHCYEISADNPTPDEVAEHHRLLWYLPDFWLPELNLWVEIKQEGYKPFGPICEALLRLSNATKTAVTYIEGIPRVEKSTRKPIVNSWTWLTTDDGDSRLSFPEKCWWVNLSGSSQIFYAPPILLREFARDHLGREEDWRLDTELLLDAYMRAQTYRFW